MKVRNPIGIPALFGIFWSLVAIPFFSQSSSSPAPAAKPTRAQERLVVDVELINVSFSVLDKKGKPVTDLSQDEFKIYEDNKAQKITNFARETDLPLTIALLIDTSTSIRDKFKFEQ